LGISKALSKYHLSYASTRLWLQNLHNESLQTEKLDVTVISSLVEATLHSIDDAAVNWVLALRDMEKSLEETISVKITVDDVKTMLEYLLFPL